MHGTRSFAAFLHGTSLLKFVDVGWSTRGTERWKGLPPHLAVGHGVHGRGVVVAGGCRLHAGEVALSVVPTAVCISLRRATKTCVICFASVDEQDGELPLGCEACRRVYWCSIACRARHAPRHAVECVFLQHLNGTIKKEESDCIVTLSALLGAMYGPQGSAVEQVTALMPDNPNGAGSKKQFRAMRDAAGKVWAWLVDAAGNGAVPESLAQELSERLLLQCLLCGPLNNFGIFDRHGEADGFCVAPLAALVNHSCVPNCAQLVAGGRVTLLALQVG